MSEFIKIQDKYLSIDMIESIEINFVSVKIITKRGHSYSSVGHIEKSQVINAIETLNNRTNLYKKVGQIKKLLELKNGNKSKMEKQILLIINSE